jgi:hypothetical protein
MAQADFRSQGARFARSQRGSVRISAALFAIALLCGAGLAGLAAVGRVDAPPLIYLVLGVIVLAAGWDLWRESRKDGDR